MCERLMGLALQSGELSAEECDILSYYAKARHDSSFVPEAQVRFVGFPLISVLFSWRGHGMPRPVPYDRCRLARHWSRPV